jgi:hypothetical protein
MTNGCEARLIATEFFFFANTPTNSLFHLWQGNLTLPKHRHQSDVRAATLLVVKSPVMA